MSNKELRNRISINKTALAIRTNNNNGKIKLMANKIKMIFKCVKLRAAKYKPKNLIACNS